MGPTANDEARRLAVEAAAKPCGREDEVTKLLKVWRSRDRASSGWGLDVHLPARSRAADVSVVGAHGRRLSDYSFEVRTLPASDRDSVLDSVLRAKCAFGSIR